MSHRLEIKSVDLIGIPETLSAEFGKDGWMKIEELDIDPNKPYRFTVTIAIGFVHEEGADNFSLYVVVADPKAWENLSPDKRYYSLYLDEFNWSKLRKLIEARVQACQQETQFESIEELRRVFHWEFEGIDEPRTIH
jgi:hypothetical protein